MRQWLKQRCFKADLISAGATPTLTRRCFKVRKKAKIRNRNTQVPHLTLDTVSESDKNTRKHHIQESQEISPFKAGDLKAARKRHDRMAKRNANSKYVLQKMNRLGTLSDKITGRLKLFSTLHGR